MLVSATPFVATGYGLLYERQNVEVVSQRLLRRSLRSGQMPIGCSWHVAIFLSNLTRN
jgi:hypothetical protein